jgi:hypothetical protein
MSKGPAAGHIDNVMQENRKFPPPAEFAKRARIGSLEEYQRLYARARDHRDEFWREQAYAELHWFRPFDTVVRGRPDQSLLQLPRRSLDEGAGRTDRADLGGRTG